PDDGGSRHHDVTHAWLAGSCAQYLRGARPGTSGAQEARGAGFTTSSGNRQNRLVTTRWRPGLLAGAGVIAATGLTVWGSLGQIQSYRDELDGSTAYSITITWWRYRIEGVDAGATPYPPYGILLAVAAGLILFAGVMALNAATNTAPGLVGTAKISSA